MAPRSTAGAEAAFAGAAEAEAKVEVEVEVDAGFEADIAAVGADAAVAAMVPGAATTMQNAASKHAAARRGIGIAG